MKEIKWSKPKYQEFRCPYCKKLIRAYIDTPPEYKQEHMIECEKVNKEIPSTRKEELSIILWDYTEWLHKLGYTDSDFYTEEPHAVDRYLNEKYK